jgi:hypothetical protein
MYFAVPAAAIAASAALAVPAASLASRAPSHALHASSLPTISVAMDGPPITVGGTLQSGGVQITSTVTTEPQGGPMFVRLDPGVTVARFFKLLASGAAADPNNLDGIASIVMDAQAPAGTSTVQADLQPGQYVGFDTAGSNPAKWPHTTFTIAKASSPAQLPAPQAAISAIEFGFRGPRTLSNGELVRFANHGFLVHMIVAAEGKDLRGARRIAALLKAGKDGQAQQLAVGFTSFANPLSHGAFQQLAVNVKPGYWVLACFMNTQDGREHTQLGMERVIHITS